MELEENHQEALVRVLDFVEPFGISAWVSFILWEVLHQRQRVPFWWPEGLPDERIDDLFILRDVAKCWFRRDVTGGTWEIVPLEAWEAHFKTVSTFDAIRAA
jgi:hypothetical protein